MNNSSAAPFALDLVVKKEVVKTKKLFSELSSETVSNIVNTSLSLQFTMLGFNIATANVVGVACCWCCSVSIYDYCKRTACYQL